MSTTVETWICRELSKLLDIDAGEDIARYILTIENVTDLEEYMRDLLDCTLPANKKFVDELLRRCKNSVHVPVGVQVYKKADIDDSYIPATEKSSKTKNKGKKKSYSSENIAPSINGITTEDDHLFTQPPSDCGLGARPKTKFVPLFSEEGIAKTVAKLPGRHACECQASKHALVNNCMSCGRVVCAQEGAGPCFFCGALVSVPHY
ncbi:hypothetical protein NP493_197g02028 [Ridgeia piscesae]|uniref:Zinc finger C2HC5-type domain-containing protein n=1 Tax=Ridgeia piscesae TaxID=27915 RepID=A0AAD9UEJ2_RIDPI|nr:hypothetical protein NP493_197g02028 [Ridgeia piscesae]